jgi:hypothetical protein
MVRSRMPAMLAAATVAGVLAAATPASPASAALGADSGPASSSAGGVFGYVWADQPTSPSYTPNLNFQDNSSGGINTITRIGVGLYRVRFPGLATDSNGGTVNVTTYGASGGGRLYCGVIAWGAAGSDILVDVRCADMSGALVDSRYDATYSLRTKPMNKSYGYVWADKKSSPAYTPALFYQFNSKGFVNTVTRYDVGYYTVHFPGLGGGKGTVKVTTYGPVSTRCKVFDWGPVGGEARVDILCSNSTGTLVDAQYTVTYGTKINLLGSSRGYGYAWADHPQSPFYTPDPSRSASKPVGMITITRNGTGRYTVFFGGVGPELVDDVQVTAWGGNATECRVIRWSPSDQGQAVDVECYGLIGELQDDYYTIQFIR